MSGSSGGAVELVRPRWQDEALPAAYVPLDLLLLAPLLALTLALAAAPFLALRLLAVARLDLTRPDLT